MEYLKGKIDGKTVYCMLYKLTPDDNAPCYCRVCIREVLQ